MHLGLNGSWLLEVLAADFGSHEIGELDVAEPHHRIREVFSGDESDLLLLPEVGDCAGADSKTSSGGDEEVLLEGVLPFGAIFAEKKIQKTSKQ